MENVIKAKALEELEAFLKNSGEDVENYIGKVFINESIVTRDFVEGVNNTTNEIVVALLAKTPQGLKVAYNNSIEYGPDATEEEVLEIISKAFPTKEEIEEAKRQQEEEMKRKEEFQKQMQELNPQELAEMLQQQQGTGVEERNDQEPTESK